MPNYQAAGAAFSELLEVMDRLRGPGGCPWDKEQTHSSLRSFLLEEAYELLDALNGDDSDKICEELGDVLHQIVFHAQIGAENGTFDAQTVIRRLKQKIVERHPHVFAGDRLTDAAAVEKRWAEMKAAATHRSAGSSLGNLPRSMPALARAQRLTERAAHLGFDWPRIEPVWQKVEEELAELRAAHSSGDSTRIASEVGDLLLSIVNLCRFLDLEAEESLAGALERFENRFRYIESKLRESGRSPAESSLEEMDRLWNEAKRLDGADAKR